MKFTKGQLRERVVLKYFERDISPVEWKEFFDFSERGIKPKEYLVGYNLNKFTGWLKILNWFGLYPKPSPIYKHSVELERILDMKKWREVNLDMWMAGVLEGSVPLFTLLGGEDKKEILPREVVDWMKKAMFKGTSADLIEKIYQEILI